MSHASKKLFIASAFALGVLAATPAARAHDHDEDWSSGRRWIESWGASPQQPVDPVVGGAPVSFSNQTIRQIARVSAGGRTIRIRLTNEYDGSPVTIDSVHVARAAAGGAIVPGTDRAVTFSGNAGVTIPAYAPALSDPLKFPLNNLDKLAITLYIHAGGNPGPATPHSLGEQTAYIASGDQTTSAQLTAATTTTVRYFLSGVDVLSDDDDSFTIVAIGDSITDGYASTVDANHRWPDYFSARLQQSDLRHTGVANEGISGNRVLSDGIGPNALSRFERDVLSRPGVRFVVLLEGVNDLGIPNLFSAGGGVPPSTQMIAGYRQLIARAHEKGVSIIGATILPYKGALPGTNYYTASGETERQAINTFIRQSGEFDGVVDFDAAMRDPANPLQLRPAYDSGDHLHPNDTGYEAMANAVDLKLFQSYSH